MEVGVASRVSAPLPARRVRGLLSRIARLTGSHAREVSVLFCGDRAMRSLNRRYRRKDRATDVLAFPVADGEFLGDIVVSVPYASRQARRRREPVSREVERLLLHGFLHLSGYDHETDNGQMRALEAKLLRRLGLEDSK
ncbi:MAG TPA: rRNA maturation RNase YbeY [Thermoanaerobaculia bacterium]|nr:rRNA maturation RNase YbeY [Thermoanaerobaculia bacterium]